MSQSQTLFDQAQGVLVGGVNSPVRAFKSVGGTPIYMKEGRGPYLVSEDDKKYIDYVLSWGPLILGHAHPEVLAALQEAIAKGTSFGTSTRSEIDLAERVRHFFPSCEKLRFVNSGTEATMSAIRLARGATGRDLIVKFEGCYHGHVDSLLVAAGSGALTAGKPDSAGVPEAFAATTRVVPYNDSDAIRSLFQSEGAQIAGIIVEPVAGNMGLVLPREGFLKTLRDLCDASGALLIFDEVMTGFRVDLGGAQELFNIQPDLTCLGKAIGGGLPVGAYGGRTALMDQVSPLGDVYQAGTLSGNPVAMAAGIATLTVLKESNAFQTAAERTSQLSSGIQDILAKKSLPWQVQSLGTMLSISWTKKPPLCLADVMKTDREKFKHFFHVMLENGVYWPPSPFETCFLSAVHSEEDIDDTLRVIDEAL